jgi:hypothetical protein
MSKKARAKRSKGKHKKANKALARALAVAGSIAGLLAVGSTAILARGAIQRASREVGRSLESGLSHLKQAWPIIDFSRGVPTSRGIS